MGVKKGAFQQRTKEKKKEKEKKSVISWRLSSLVSSVMFEQKRCSQGEALNWMESRAKRNCGMIKVGRDLKNL